MVFHTSSDDETASALTPHAQPDSSIAMQSRITVIFFGNPAQRKNSKKVGKDV